MSDESDVRALIENWAKAVSNGNREGNLERHASTVTLRRRSASRRVRQATGSMPVERENFAHPR